MDKKELICPCCETTIWVSEEVLSKDNYIACYICGAILKNDFK